MEDAHIAQCDINADGHPNDLSIFGVFDGHGGLLFFVPVDYRIWTPK